MDEEYMPKIIMASGPVIVRDNMVLLNQHGDDPFWKFCGGKVEDYEFNLVETARREFAEEMGAQFEVLNPKPFFFHTTKGEIDIVLVHFQAGLVGEIKQSDDIRRWGWFELDKLSGMELAPNIVPTLVHFGYLKE